MRPLNRQLNIKLGKANKGFSLIELAVVLAIMAVLISLTITHSTFLRKVIVRAEIEKLHSICCYLRQVAQLGNKQCVLTFDTGNGSYKYEDTSETLPRYIHFGAAPDLLGPPSRPDKNITEGITFPDNQIVFYPTGIVHAGTVYLSDTDNTYTYALTCAVSQASYLRKYYYNTRWELIS